MNTTDPETPRPEVFWGYEDLALFIGALLPAFAGGLLMVRPIHFRDNGVQGLAYQCCVYALLLGALYLLISWRYRRPFWRSLGWNYDYRGAWIYVLIGVSMAIGLTALTAVLHAPGNPAIQDLVTNRSSLIAVVLFGSLIGPIFEELVFRGFLQPLFAKSMGAWLGIVAAAIPFALMHGQGFGWAWRSIVVIGIAGVILGYVRERSGSTAASALVHVVYNSTLFAGFLLQRSL